MRNALCLFGVVFAPMLACMAFQEPPAAPAPAEVIVDSKIIPTMGLISGCKIVSVHDGDSLTVIVPVKLQCRFLDCWSPELSRPAFDKDGKPILNPKTGKQKMEPNPKGVRARDNLKRLAEGKSGVIHIPFDNGESIDVGKLFTFGRVLCKIEVNGDDLSYQQCKGKFASATKPEEEATKPNE